MVSIRTIKHDFFRGSFGPEKEFVLDDYTHNTIRGVFIQHGIAPEALFAFNFRIPCDPVKFDTLYSYSLHADNLDVCSESGNVLLVSHTGYYPDKEAYLHLLDHMSSVGSSLNGKDDNSRTDNAGRMMEEVPILGSNEFSQYRCILLHKVLLDKRIIKNFIINVDSSQPVITSTSFGGYYIFHSKRYQKGLYLMKIGELEVADLTDTEDAYIESCAIDDIIEIESPNTRTTILCRYVDSNGDVLLYYKDEKRNVIKVAICKENTVIKKDILQDAGNMSAMCNRRCVEGELNVLLLFDKRNNSLRCCEAGYDEDLVECRLLCDVAPERNLYVGMEDRLYSRNGHVFFVCYDIDRNMYCLCDLCVKSGSVAYIDIAAAKHIAIIKENVVAKISIDFISFVAHASYTYNSINSTHYVAYYTEGGYQIAAIEI